MAGLNLTSGVGLSGSVFANGWPGYQSAAVPRATTVPEGPGTITQQGFGVPGVGGGGRKGTLCALIGTASVAVLWFLWWSLPR